VVEMGSSSGLGVCSISYNSENVTIKHLEFR